MNKYIVYISPQAERELDDIYKYISGNLKAPETALKLVEQIEQAILDLNINPHRGAFRKIGKYSDYGYRQLFVKNYTILYRIDEEAKIVIIITVKYTPMLF